jgi:hypothetical protein
VFSTSRTCLKPVSRVYNLRRLYSTSTPVFAHLRLLYGPRLQNTAHLCCFRPFYLFLDAFLPRCARFTHVPNCRHPLSTTPRQHTHFRALRHTLCPFLSIFTYFYSFFNLFLRVFYVFLRVFTRVQPTAHISDKQRPPLLTFARFLALFRRKKTHF